MVASHGMYWSAPTWPAFVSRRAVTEVGCVAQHWVKSDTSGLLPNVRRWDGSAVLLSRL